MPANDVETMLTEIGFACIQIDKKEQSKEVIATWMPGSGAEDYVVSANISAVKPGPSASSSCSTAPTASSSSCCAPAANGSKQGKAMRK